MIHLYDYQQHAPSFRAYPCRRKQCQAWHIAHRITKGRKGKR